MRYLNIKLLFFIFFFILLLTFIIPSGQYINNTFSYIQKPEMSIKFILDSIFLGLSGIDNTTSIGYYNQGIMIGCINIIFLIICISAFTQLIDKLKYFNLIITKITSYNINIKIITALISIFFITNASIQGMYETSIAFYPLLITLYKKYDTDSYFVLKLMIYSMAVGHIASTINPFFTLIITQNLDIELTDGIFNRIILLIILALVTISHLVTKVQNKDIEKTNIKLTIRQKVSVILVLLPYILMTLLLLPYYDYSLNSIGTIFLLIGTIIALINNCKLDFIIDVYVGSITKVIPIILTVILARSIYILLENTFTIDTLIYYFTNFFTNIPERAIYILLIFFFLFLSFFITSTSAISILVIPIFGNVFNNLNYNIVDLILLLQVPVGVMKIISPTSVLVLTLLEYEKVSIFKWIKSAYPYTLLILFISVIFILI